MGYCTTIEKFIVVCAESRQAVDHFIFGLIWLCWSGGGGGGGGIELLIFMIIYKYH
jgi:hypothetical protein